jgi:hypothetical protein
LEISSGQCFQILFPITLFPIFVLVLSNKTKRSKKKKGKISSSHAGTKKPVPGRAMPETTSMSYNRSSLRQHLATVNEDDILPLFNDFLTLCAIASADCVAYCVG